MIARSTLPATNSLRVTDDDPPRAILHQPRRRPLGSRRRPARDGRAARPLGAAAAFARRRAGLAGAGARLPARLPPWGAPPRAGGVRGAVLGPGPARRRPGPLAAAAALRPRQRRR